MTGWFEQARETMKGGRTGDVAAKLLRLLKRRDRLRRKALENRTGRMS